jgi:hypothetical protein
LPSNEDRVLDSGALGDLTGVVVLVERLGRLPAQCEEAPTLDECRGPVERLVKPFGIEEVQLEERLLGPPLGDQEID